MINGDRAVLYELNRITYDLVSLLHWSYRLDVVVLLESIDDGLKRRDVGVHLLTERLQRLDSLFMIGKLLAQTGIIVARCHAD